MGAADFDWGTAFGFVLGDRWGVLRRTPPSLPSPTTTRRLHAGWSQGGRGFDQTSWPTSMLPYLSALGSTLPWFLCNQRRWAWSPRPRGLQIHQVWRLHGWTGAGIGWMARGLAVRECSHAEARWGAIRVQQTQGTTRGCGCVRPWHHKPPKAVVDSVGMEGSMDQPLHGAAFQMGIIAETSTTLHGPPVDGTPSSRPWGSYATVSSSQTWV